LDDIKTLYPIGAGDATAGGLVAAWTTLESFGSDFRPILRQSTVDILLGLHEKVDKNVVVTAFAFGLCCGSASCLQEENSFVDINDVDNLLRHFGEIKCMGIFNNRDEPS
jgi:fructose-1-phosphate kinase PfkB-like protein